jgi:energy-coupling factor transporter transmembrane protein EcfT
MTRRSARRPVRRPGTTVGEINLFRYVPRSSPVHRLWAGTKVVGLVGVGVAVSLRPTWWGELLVLGALMAVMALARVPIGALPRFPRWFFIGVGITLISAVLAGGKPHIHIGRTALAVGGLDQWGRFTLLVVVLIGSTALVGWTTRGADLTPALATLVSPARLVKVPVDEVATVVALAVRCMPLLVDELRVMAAARRVRNPPTPQSLRQVAAEIHDILVTALVSAARRAQEMADAIEARGGVGTVVRSRPEIRAAEVTAWLVTAGLITGAILL